ncbi:MAG: AGE family epimerase/isomerase [Alphaproteobacteria bacterium]|jgi:mannose/cellobiose epimerase-like protein (N-acyl-D-glucosamine 2-epimerase family)
MTAHRVSSDRIADWLHGQALPLWSQAGLDAKCGGFVETLTLDHRPNLDRPKRLRVQARQTYVYSHAHLIGWTPPHGGPTALEAAAHGFDFMTRHYWDATTGGFVFAATRDGRPADSRIEAYEQAFALFACAWYHQASGDATAREWTERIVAWLDANLADPVQGGLRESLAGGLPRRQNPHMHYLEALLALYRATGETQWLDRAAAIVALFRSRFFDPGTGTLGEFFTEDWQPAPGTEGRIVEPGHHFEWVWLLHEYGRLAETDMTEDAAALYRFGEAHGRDRNPGAGADLAFDGVLRSGTIHDDRKRLWVQTEAIKAQLARREHAGDEAAGAILETLLDALFERYLAIGHGSWYDHLDRAGRPFGDNAPASSFYHVFLALTEALRERGDLAAL